MDAMAFVRGGVRSDDPVPRSVKAGLLLGEAVGNIRASYRYCK